MNKKLLLIPIALVLCGVAIYAASLYFHQVPVTMTIDEGRTSTDMPVNITGLSGETVSWTSTIRNQASVPLNARLNITEVSNPDGVIYTCDDTGLINLDPGVDTSVYPSCVINATTPAGIVELLINYYAVE